MNQANSRRDDYKAESNPGAVELIRVAALQMEPHIGDKGRNMAETFRMIDAGAADGARLLVLPELCNTGYAFSSREEAFLHAEPVPGGPCTAAWIRKAVEHDVYLCAGIAERDGEFLYDSVVVVGPTGYIGTYRKMHLWDEEKLWFEPGNLGFPVFDLPFWADWLSYLLRCLVSRNHPDTRVAGCRYHLRLYELGRCTSGPDKGKTYSFGIRCPDVTYELGLQHLCRSCRNRAKLYFYRKQLYNGYSR